MALDLDNELHIMENVEVLKNQVSEDDKLIKKKNFAPDDENTASG